MPPLDGLHGGETSPVNAVVDPEIDEIIDRIYLAAQRLWVEVQRGIALFIEGQVEYADNLRRLVGNDRFFFFSQSTGTVTRPE